MARVFPVKVVLSLIALGGVLWLATNAHVYNDYLRGIYFSLTLVSVTVIHLRLHAERRDIFGVLAAGAALALIDFQVCHFVLSAFGVLSLLGIASFSAIALRAIWQNGASKERWALAFVHEPPKVCRVVRTMSTTWSSAIGCATASSARSL